mmetsp:Transcript_19057/g.30818  ORF Transcript_19057/g.30818 Transcript_19057/m.30818 type:complete len:152 (-) Transcript_19057:11-466(-)
MRTVRSTVVGENADDKEQLPPEQDCTDQRWNLSSANAYGMMSRLAVSIYKGTAPVPVVGRLTKAAVSMAEKTLTWSGLPRLLEGEELLRDDSSCTSFIVIDTKLRHAFLLLDEKVLRRMIKQPLAIILISPLFLHCLLVLHEIKNFKNYAA